jgi:hypothetical protein
MPRRLPIDEARLRPHLRAGREKGELPVSAAVGDVLEAEAEVVRRRRARVVVPSPGELRGLPAIGWGWVVFSLERSRSGHCSRKSVDVPARGCDEGASFRLGSRLYR